MAAALGAAEKSKDQLLIVCQEDHHKDWIEILSYDHQVTQPAGR
jgi:hypothetical protein